MPKSYTFFRLPKGEGMSAGAGALTFIKPPEKPRANILLVGPPKSGKTIGAASAPPGVLFLNFDLPNASRQAHLRHPDGSIMEPKIPEFVEGSRPLFAFMMTVMKEVQKPDQTMISTVVVDKVDELYRRLLEEFSNRSVRPSLPTYGEVSVQVERFIRALCTVPTVNTVIVCTDMVMQNGDETIFIPFTGTKAGSADLGAKLASMVDILAYTVLVESDGGDKQSLAQLIPLKGRNGGDRFDCLGNWRPLDISEWLSTIEAHERGEEVKRFDQQQESANVGTNGQEPEADSRPDTTSVTAQEHNKRTAARSRRRAA